jgi:hypothetical protein
VGRWELPENPTLQQLIHWSLRRDQLCAGPHACDESTEVRSEPVPGAPDGLLMRRERCESCPLNQIDAAVVQEPVQHRAFNLDFALQAGVRIGLEDISCDEWQALKILRTERDRYQAEQMKKQQNQR